jgi:hypothetical protein
MPDQDSLHVLEQALRAHRPDADLSLLHAIGASLREPQRPRRARGRVTAAAALTAVLAAALAATGGLSYAANSVARAGKVARSVATADRTSGVRRVTAGGDQYRPGYGFGDPNHNHDGPPGLATPKAAAEAGPPVGEATLPDASPVARVFGTSVAFDEQAHLYISVVDARGRALLLTQHSRRGGSLVGDGLTGPQTKVIQYAVLVPRELPIRLRVPANLLAQQRTYRIRIVAVDPDGNKSRLLIPFQT